MVTFTVRSHVGKDGILNLQVPTGVEDTDVDIVIVMQPHRASVEYTNVFGYPRLFFQETFGSLPQLQELETEGDFELREEFA